MFHKNASKKPKYRGKIVNFLIYIFLFSFGYVIFLAETLDGEIELYEVVNEDISIFFWDNDWLS